MATEKIGPEIKFLLLVAQNQKRKKEIYNNNILLLTLKKENFKGENNKRMKNQQSYHDHGVQAG